MYSTMYREVCLLNSEKPLIKDPSSKGQPLYKGHFQYPQSIYAIHFNIQKKGLKRAASLQGTKWLVPKCPLLRGFTVV